MAIAVSYTERGFGFARFLRVFLLKQGAGKGGEEAAKEGVHPAVSSLTLQKNDNSSGSSSGSSSTVAAAAAAGSNSGNGLACQTAAT